MSGNTWYWRNRLQARVETLLPDRELHAIADRFGGATALEIGGPSALFGAHGRMPVYLRLRDLDSANYAKTTVWDGGDFDGIAVRSRFVAEAVDLGVPDGAYDAILASHVIEHVADPVRALLEWQRAMRPDGLMLLVVPHRDGTFDHLRPVTQTDHFLTDAQSRTPEDDLSHLDEILRLHDLTRDPGVTSVDDFAQRSRANACHRALHHHVFVSRTVAELCSVVGLDVEFLLARRPFHIICLARPARQDGGSRAAAQAVFDPGVFPSDRFP